MKGLLIKDFYVIGKTFQPIVLIAVLPAALVSLRNGHLLMPILMMVILFFAAGQVTETMRLDEIANWKRNVTAMPVSALAEVCGKYCLLLLLVLVSTALFFALGLLAVFAQIVAIKEVLIYAALGAFLAFLYQFISIPATYKFGTAKSKYVLMAFIILPTSIPLVLSVFHISLDWILTVDFSGGALLAIATIVFIAGGLISFPLAVKARQALG